jgi:transcriptional regulator with XRE-family HTH domain
MIHFLLYCHRHNRRKEGGILREEERRGEAVTRLRERKLWTREKLAQEAKVSPTTVTGVEEARTRVRLGTIRKLAEALEVDPMEILHPEEVAAPLAGAR